MRSYSKSLVLLVFTLCLLFGQAYAALAADAVAISINQTQNLAVGYAKPLVLTAAPAGAALPAVEWKSSNEAVATVDQNGVVTGVKAGKATITATAGSNADITASVDLVVRNSYRYKIGWGGNFNQADNNQTTTAALPINPNKVQKVWQAHVGNSTVAIVDDYVYTYNGTSLNGENNGGVLYKIDKNTGNVVNSLQCSGSCNLYYSYTIYGGGLLYVSCVGSVMAFDLDSFALLWTAETDPAVNYPTIQYVNNCVVTNGYVLDAVTGAKKATLPGGYSYSSGVEKNGLFYIAAADGKIYAFSTADWSVKYSLKFGDGNGGNQPGVAFAGNRLYWGSVGSGNLYSVQINDTTGAFAEDTLKTVACGVSGPCVPVIANGRIYLAGTHNGNGAVAVVRAADMSLQYVAYGAVEKIQSTPIVRIVTADGPVVSALAAEPAAVGVAEGNYVFMQDYGSAASPSRILLLADNAAATAGSLNKLFTVDNENWAYEQIACDKEGALYVTNDSGFLIKYAEATVSVPTFDTDLSAAEVNYGLGADAAELRVVASVTDEGSISYQWQQKSANGVWTDIANATNAAYTPATNAEGTTYYRCVVTNTLNGQAATATSKAAKIVVVAGTVSLTYGDVNNDGNINGKDVALLKRYIVNPTDTDINVAAADVDANGSVTGKDVALLKRYVAKWQITLGPAA